jgi:hypothetical protein
MVEMHPGDVLTQGMRQREIVVRLGESDRGRAEESEGSEISSP